MAEDGKKNEPIDNGIQPKKGRISLFKIYVHLHFLGLRSDGHRWKTETW